MCVHLRLIKIVKEMYTNEHKTYVADLVMVCIYFLWQNKNENLCCDILLLYKLYFVISFCMCPSRQRIKLLCLIYWFCSFFIVTFLSLFIWKFTALLQLYYHKYLKYILHTVVQIALCIYTSCFFFMWLISVLEIRCIDTIQLILVENMLFKSRF